MNKRYSLLIFFIVVLSMKLEAQIKLYEDRFNGGVTAGGYSPGTGVSGNGYFSIHIATGSTIRKSYLLAGKQGATSPTSVILNGNSILFDTSTALTSFYSLYGGVASVHAVDVSSLINATDTNYTLSCPLANASDVYTDFYLYVAYDNPTMEIVNTAIFINDRDFDTIVPFHMNLSVPIISSVNVGLSCSLGYMCGYGDGEYVYVNGINIGYLWKTDANSSIACGGTMGSFYYENNLLFGLNSDYPDIVMDSSDGLSNIQSILPPITTSVYLEFRDDSSGHPDNSTWLAVLAYGNIEEGTQDFYQSSFFSTYPNPFINKLNVNIKDDNLAEITLYDIALRKLIQQNFTRSTSINTSQLAKGVYIYKIRNKNGIMGIGKVIKE